MKNVNYPFRAHEVATYDELHWWASLVLPARRRVLKLHRKMYVDDAAALFEELMKLFFEWEELLLDDDWYLRAGHL